MVASGLIRLLLLLWSSTCLAAEARVEMRVDRTQLAVGEPLIVTIDYRWPATWSVAALPRPAEDFATAGAFLTEIPPVSDVSDGSERRVIQHLTVLATRSGAWALPRPLLTVTDATGQSQQVQAPEVIVQVGSGGDEPQLAAARPPWDARSRTDETSGTSWWLIGALMTVLAATLWWLRPRRHAPPRPAEARFQDELLLARATVDGKHAATLLSLALRRYLGVCYAFDGAAATTNECRRELHGKLPSERRLSALRILEQLDGLRWSTPGLETGAVAPLLTDAETWVQADAAARAAAQAAAAK